MEAARPDPKQAGVFVDFDGTLSAIAARPDDARAQPGATAALAALGDRLGLVAVVSGRPLASLQDRLAGAGRCQLVGLYGLERATASGEPVPVAEEVERWRPAVEAAADEVESVAPAGVTVERKGLVATFHFRADPGRRGWVEELVGSLAARTGLKAHGGKMSVELRPPVSTDKGAVLAELGGRLDPVAFAGDDLGDLPAFAELGRRRAAGTTTLTVASAGLETPAELTGAADLVVDGPDGVVELLEQLVSALG